MVDKANKTVLNSEFKNDTHVVETHVKYECHSGFTYTSDNPEIMCTDNGYDNTIGKCVKGAFK